MRKLMVMLTAATALAGCGSPEPEYSNEAPQSEFGFREAMSPGLPSIMPPQAPVSDMAAEEAAEMAMADVEEAIADTVSSAQVKQPAGMPQIAYSYDYGFRIDSGDLTALQQQHADLCVSRGPDVCRIISMRQSGASGEYGYGRLDIEVVANEARDFGKELVGTTEIAGGEQVSSSITGEDLSKQIVDTEARLRARTLLRDRLMEVLRSRSGTVAELVEAERGVAQVNEEIDQAQSWLAEMRGRVAFSDISIEYQSGERSAGGFWEPVSWALNSASSTFGRAIGAIIMLVVGLTPWLILLGLVIWGWRKARLPFFKWPRRRKAEARYASEVNEDEAEPDAGSEAP